jgi:hypothetical protein
VVVFQVADQIKSVVKLQIEIVMKVINTALITIFIGDMWAKVFEADLHLAIPGYFLNLRKLSNAALEQLAHVT